MSKKSMSSKITKCNPYHNKRNGILFSHKILPGENNLHYFTFSPNSEKPIKAAICHLPWTGQQKIFPTALRT
jgi:hypothetical protein